MTRPSKLDQTTNILQLYTHHTGTSEVPPEFHLWAAISLIAACVSDRVWFSKFRSSKLHPNLYTFLLGPSGCLSGDTQVTINRGKRNGGRAYTLAELHRMMHGGVNYARTWDQAIPSRIMSLKDDLVMYRNIADVIYQGEKQTFTVSIRGHRPIHATADHRFLTDQGYKRLDELKAGDKLVVRGKPRREKRVQKFRRSVSARFHPRARQKLVTWKGCPEGKVYPTIPYAWAVYEATLNELPLDEYLRIVHEDQAAARRLRYTPEGHEIHHKDGDCNNDVPDNLEALSPLEHGRLHVAGHLKKMGHFTTTLAKVVSIKPRKVEPVYDISMEDQDAPNFSVGGVIVHNCGKGESVGMALRYVQDLPQVGTYVGNTTAQFMLKHLGRTYTDDYGNEVSNSKLFLVTEELAMSVGSGPQAEDFVRHMTGLYKGGEYMFEKGTVTGGHTKIKGHCLNWLAGTTLEWAVKCIPRDCIEGGFLGRVAIVDGRYDVNKRIVRPRYPHDFEQIREHLLERFAMLTRVHGQFRMSRRAQLIEEQWYTQRPAPDEDSMLPTWRREHDLSLKLAMILALADLMDENEELVMRARHVEVGQKLVQECHKAAPQLQRAAATTRDSETVEVVRRLIERAGEIQRSALQRKLSPRGIHKEAMDAALATLMTEENVRSKLAGRTTVYTYQKRRLTA